jgi:hypothetical protein
MQNIQEQEAYKELHSRQQKALNSVIYIRDSKWLLNHDNINVRNNVTDSIDQALDDAIDALRGK